ncbi:MAG: M23 family metallopeptidase [Alphaproteobacteria bacterium]|nr:M23 family metallopeptidase [Alphaproteobacteria bacterium]
MRSASPTKSARLSRLTVALCLAIAFVGTACSHTPAEAARFGSTPSFGAPEPKAKPYRVKVAAGDTLWSLARRHDVALSTLASANGLTAPYALRAGQTLEIPAPPSVRVREGETLDQIARAYRVDRAELAELNRLGKDGTIRSGQSLLLPDDAAKRRLDGVATAPRAVAAAPSPAAKPAAKAAKRQFEPAPAPARYVSSSGRVPSGQERPLAWPVEGRIISTFGAKDGGLYNDGINIAVATGTPVKAAEDGVVVYHGNELRAFGNLVLLEHPGGVITAYAHNSRLKVRKGDKVARGDVIAYAGSSGTVAEPQLHFEVREGTKAKDPLTFLSARRILVSSR